MAFFMGMSLLCVLSLLSLFALSLALDPDPARYDRGPVSFDEKAELWYGSDLRAGTASFALRIVDPTVVNESLTSTWIGVGVSESTSGSMLGGDILSAQFTDDKNCLATDRYVPFFAYPLIESTADAPSAFPFADDCQDDGSWVVHRCERDFTTGEMLIEVSRPLEAHDTQDRSIEEGPVSMIYSYGNEFQYHGGNRGAMQVTLFLDRNDPDSKPPAGEPELPDDVDGSFEVLATNYEVPSNMSTTYSCTTQRVDLGGNGQRMIVAVEPVLDAPIDMVHHFTLYLCRNEEYAELTKETTTCMSLNGINGPLANPKAGCSTFVYGYAKGVSRLVLPREAGILVNAEKSFLVMESHFDNGDLIKGNIDNSGVRVFYTDTMREHEAGALLVGDSLVARFGEKVKTDFEYENSCPSECTSKFKQDINIFSSFLHMHTTGKDIYTNVFSKNGTYLDTMNKINFWSDRFQQSRLFKPQYVLRAGQQLITTCTYDTTKRPETQFGLETTDEMCMDFLGYWPLQRDPVTGNEINICAYFQGDDSSMTATVCGDNGMINTEGIILDVPNPKFEDEIGAATTFGDFQTCPTPDVLEQTPTPALEEGTGNPTTQATPIATTEQNEVDDGSTLPATDDETPPSATPSSLEATAPPSIDESPNPSPTSANDDDDDVCFPGSATVELRNGHVKPMRDLSVGDEVLVGAGGQYSAVMMFTHKDAQRIYRFVALETSCGQTLHATSSHYIYANDVLIEAGDVRAGDLLEGADGRKCEVRKVGVKQMQGLYNPQTVHGDVIVDGVRASTYTRAVSVETAHALLAPVRWMFAAVGLDASAVVIGL